MSELRVVSVLQHARQLGLTCSGSGETQNINDIYNEKYF